MTRQEIEMLIHSIALADRKAFNALYDHISPKLLGICLRITGGRLAAEAALQDTFIHVWKNADRFAAIGYGPMTWLITLARNTSIDHQRGGRPTINMEDYADAIAATRPHSDMGMTQSVALRQIEKYLADIEPTRRAAIKSAYLDGLAYPDLAQKSNVPLKTMRTWLRRGLISLKERLCTKTPSTLTPNDTEFAGEYVLRVLPTAAHRAAAKRAVDDPEFADEIRMWEDSFVALTDEIMPVSPSIATKTTMMDLLFGANVKLSLFQRTGTWKAICAVLALLTLALLALIVVPKIGVIL